MAREISLSKRLKIVEFVPSGPGSTRAFCRRMGVSLRSFYRIRSRWSGSGTSWLHPASRAPRRPRRRYGPDVEAAVAAGHAELTGRGLDAGGITVRFHLQQQGMDPLPSVATINRILARNGPSRVQRAKRPRSSYTRFARSRTCELWQPDAFEVALTGGDRATVYQIIDDASRLCIALTARTRAANPADAIDAPGPGHRRSRAARSGPDRQRGGPRHPPPGPALQHRALPGVFGSGAHLRISPDTPRPRARPNAPTTPPANGSRRTPSPPPPIWRPP